MMGGYPDSDPKQKYATESGETSRADNETHFTSNMPIQTDQDEENQEIDFDKLLGDAVMSQAEYEEDRDDQFEDDDNDDNE